ncbi:MULTISPECIES: phage tail tape measure protein [unclassified Rhizobium]|uniref:phage tail tape measure protein n=1 Tax=unclassified Rhizobium TaxID=2613769 RepID=UPI001ADB7B08|nr:MULTISPECIES: phage tail tape measure protein [unclassified Rhizobium]MBO9125447.1 phage tail tape measure protein [Rhizobium sp. 16-488-2b]MBO9176032.1 phage tail tape measure protein [Rhizobium sp. 16-488-2a]
MTTHESRLRITLLDQVTSRARSISSALGGIEKQASSFTAPFRSLTAQLLAFGGAYLGISEGVKATAGAAIGFESAFADVRKVVDANEEQFENLRRTIRKMSTEVPLAADDIAALFAAAGESGVATNDLKAFSEMASRVGIAFDMSAGEAGESLAKLKTQLGLSVSETGDMADAINHLSNNMASKAKDITNYMLRVGALAEMGGFTKEQIAGIGSAMIAAGAEAETAGTAMQNVVKALTKGDSAKKGQRDVAEALGLDLPQIAKEMQKDAPKAMRKVLRAIAKAPKDRHIALLSDFFGDEAKAFAPLIGNMGLLDQALDSVSDKAKYSGSAFKEFVERSNTTANALQLLRNKVSNVFWAMGDEMLPTIKEAVSGIGYVIDTLDSRVSVFDEIKTGIQGFAQGLGYAGIRDVIEDLGDLLVGKIDPNAGDRLGRIFVQAKEWGASIRELNAAIKDNPIAQFLADLAPYGLQIALWAAGIGFLAGTIRSLASALMLLSGASAIIGALKTVGSIADIVSGGTFPKGGGKPGKVGGATSPAGDGAAAAGVASIWTWMKGLSIAGAPALMSEAMSFTPGDTFDEQVKNQRQYREDLQRLFGVDPLGLKRNQAADPGVSSSMAIDAARGARAAGIGGSTTETLPGKTADDLGIAKPIALDAASIDQISQPRGTQDVNVTNPRPAPNVNINLTIPVHGVTNPEELANKVSSLVGQQLRDQVAGIYADTGYGVA